MNKQTEKLKKILENIIAVDTYDTCMKCGNLIDNESPSYIAREVLQACKDMGMGFTDLPNGLLHIPIDLTEPRLTPKQRKAIVENDGT